MWWRRSRWHAIAKVGELHDGAMIAVTIAGIELVLGRNGERYFAVQRRCPHRGSDLSAGMIASDRLVCPQHGWRFSTETGRHDGLIDACLDTYDVRVTGDEIAIDIASRRRR